jgi:RimJ/RimL family protein N-acetyltransferase
MRLVIGKDQNVAKWVALKIPALGGADGNIFGPCAAIGVVDSSGRPLAGIVFHDYQERFRTIQMSFAAESPRWATRNMVRQLLAYAFVQLKCQKVWCAIEHTNERALRVAQGLKFKKEGIMARQFGKSHAVLFRMFHEDYRRHYGGKRK